MQRQGQKGNHFDPVVAFVQVGPFVFQNVLLGLAVHAEGNIDPGPDKSQDEGGVDSVALPTAPDFYRVCHSALHFQVGNQAVNAETGGDDAPDPGQDRSPYPGRHAQIRQCKRRLQAEVTLNLNGHQQTDACQQPQHADVLFRCLPQHKPQKDHGQNHNASVNAGCHQISKKLFHG